jgi:hypothetical protein
MLPRISVQVYMRDRSASVPGHQAIRPEAGADTMSSLLSYLILHLHCPRYLDASTRMILSTHVVDTGYQSRTLSPSGIFRVLRGSGLRCHYTSNHALWLGAHGVWREEDLICPHEHIRSCEISASCVLNCRFLREKSCSAYFLWVNDRT